MLKNVIRNSNVANFFFWGEGGGDRVMERNYIKMKTLRFHAPESEGVSEGSPARVRLIAWGRRRVESDGRGEVGVREIY